MTMNELSQYEQSVFVCAARYAHRRNTGAALQVVTAILSHWDKFSKETQDQLKREALTETNCNLDDWTKLINAQPTDYCKKCGGKMKQSTAIQQTYTAGTPDFPGDKHGITMSPGGLGKIINALKCERCGWSVTG